MTFLEEALQLRFAPLAISYAQELPQGVEMPPTICSMFMLAQAAMGRTVAIAKDSCPCYGAACGFGLAPLDAASFPGGESCFLRFLSTGNGDTEEGRAVLDELSAANAPKILLTEFEEGEGFLKSPELAEDWMAGLPKASPEGPYVVIKPLSKLEDGEKPKSVIFLADPDQLSALCVLANFRSRGVDRVRMPFASGCGSVGLYAFAEAGSPEPHAVVGLTDISARFYLGRLLGHDILSFTVPYAMYEEMVEDAPQSFLSRFAWKTMMGMRQRG